MENINTNKQFFVRLHLTNVTGTGATQLLQSLLPALEQSDNPTIAEMYLPESGALANYLPKTSSIIVKRYRRWLPHSLSRLLECTLFGRNFNGNSPILVLGDLPLRCNASQIVFVQNSHLLNPTQFRWNFTSIKFSILRMIFRFNMGHASFFIVQTKLMMDNLIATYPKVRGRVHVVSQPVPVWLIEKKFFRKMRNAFSGNGLNLIYPAETYPHKNHQLLSAIKVTDKDKWPVKRLVLTILKDLNPAPFLPWIDCVGFLSSQQMINEYTHADALLFLSLDESYGFPLVEAMFIGLPIICPNLPYARLLCGDQAVYFDPNSLNSLKVALEVLNNKITNGWWPDWSQQMSVIPNDWNLVGNNMLNIVKRTQVS
jgi:hypothetical protein